MGVKPSLTLEKSENFKSDIGEVGEFPHFYNHSYMKTPKPRYGQFDLMAICSTIGALNNPYKPIPESHPRNSFLLEIPSLTQVI